ncbi:MAG: pyridoxine 5'-phosphate synthase [Vicinamibacteria bacterium]|nr:pyridoxine 5'-phosphate synthase [Vicinamibacteria bacterium]
MARLCVNIDHVATLRQARRGSEPDPIHAAVLAELAGAAGVVVHLRGDRRHVQDRDVELLRQVVKSRLTLATAATQEMLRIALTVRPDQVTLVPERPQELTTEGGLDAVLNSASLKGIVGALVEAGIRVAVFVSPELEQVKECHRLGATAVELSAAVYGEARGERPREAALRHISDAARLGRKLGLRTQVGHGLDYESVRAVAALPEVDDVTVGHAVVARALLVGMERAVREMLDAMRP